MCNCCKKLETEDSSDFKFYGDRKHKIKNLAIGQIYDSIDTSIQIEYETNAPYMIAFTTIFGLDIESKHVKIKYCPFCGRKLTES